MTARLCRSAHLWAVVATLAAAASHGEIAAQVNAANGAPTPSASRPDSTPPPKPVPQQTPGAFMNIGFVGIVNAGWSSEPNVPSLELGDHDPRVRGFTIPNT